MEMHDRLGQQALASDMEVRKRLAELQLSITEFKAECRAAQHP